MTCCYIGTVNNDWQALQPGGIATPALGGTISGTIGTATAFVSPLIVAVNGIPCSVIVLSGQGNSSPRRWLLLVFNPSALPDAILFLLVSANECFDFAVLVGQVTKPTPPVLCPPNRPARRRLQ